MGIILSQVSKYILLKLCQCKKKTYISQMSQALTFFTAFSKEYLLFMTLRVCLVGIMKKWGWKI